MNRNHHVFFDNFFTTTKLLEHLETNDTYACGTVRYNRKQGVVQVPCPAVLKDYKYMCGIDQADQNNWYYSVGRNGKHWPHYFISFLYGVLSLLRAINQTLGLTSATPKGCVCFV